ncbi:MAG TPA: antibiotic biosynthesis monooxygenase [Drouetiella sp.]
MFAVIYHFRVHEGCEQQFQESWCRLTEQIRDSHGGLGSRLHQASDGRWIAYAQWPSREAWKALSASTGDITEAQVSMRAACESVETLFELDVKMDLLVKDIPG